MPILNERRTWRRPHPSDTPRNSSDLTPDEQVNIRVAVRFLRKRMGGMMQLASAMGSKLGTLTAAMHLSVSAGIAVRVARAAGVPLEEILAGRWPAATTCAYCGRG